MRSLTIGIGRPGAALDELLDGHTVALIVEPADGPAGWEVGGGIAGTQMDGIRLSTAADRALEVLGPNDVREMLALVERTRRGPFRRRTVELGTYLGLRGNGELAAMAGERLHPSGWAEISAVCTDESFGRRLGTRLVRAVGANIGDRGERALPPYRRLESDGHPALSVTRDRVPAHRDIHVVRRSRGAGRAEGQVHRRWTR